MHPQILRKSHIYREDYELLRSIGYLQPGRCCPMTAGPAIMFEAFDREGEHLYELQFGKGPHDPEGPCYSLDPRLGAEFGGGKPDADARANTVDSLGGGRGVRLLVRLRRRLVAPDQRRGHRG